MPVQLVPFKAAFALGSCHLKGQVRFCALLPQFPCKALLSIPCSEIPENVTWRRGGGPAQRSASLLVFRTESGGNEAKPDDCCPPPGPRECRIKELLAKPVPSFPGSPNTCTAACKREASVSLEINYQGPFNELLASRAHLMSCLHLIQFRWTCGWSCWSPWAHGAGFRQAKASSQTPDQTTVSPLSSSQPLLRYRDSCQCLKFHHRHSFLWA